MFSVFVAMSISLVMQPPEKLSQAPRPGNQNPGPLPPRRIPPHNTWHQWHGRPLVQFNAVLPSPVVVIQNPDTVYAQVDGAGNIVATFRLVQVESAPVVVVPQQTYRGGWFFGHRRWR